MRLMQFTASQIALIVAPVLILICELFAFLWFTKWFGFTRGYLVAFMLYWIICLILSLWIVGYDGFKNLFHFTSAPFGKPAMLGIILLILPPLLAGLTAFRVNIQRVSFLILLVSAGLALVNGTLEEVLWRGAYVTVFPKHLTLGYLYPALGFAVWHLAPQIVRPSSMPGGIISFILGALFLGLCWGWVAWQTNSIILATISHVLTDFLGLGALVYLSR